MWASQSSVKSPAIDAFLRAGFSIRWLCNEECEGETDEREKKRGEEEGDLWLILAPDRQLNLLPKMWRLVASLALVHPSSPWTPPSCNQKMPSNPAPTKPDCFVYLHTRQGFLKSYHMLMRTVCVYTPLCEEWHYFIGHRVTCTQEWAAVLPRQICTQSWHTLCRNSLLESLLISEKRSKDSWQESA